MSWRQEKLDPVQLVLIRESVDPGRAGYSSRVSTSSLVLGSEHRAGADSLMQKVRGD
ncbi:hypothetical protein [Microbulbifer taiwanensis]|uniref:Uncharacterized protein n=1 Tax=Microbulbifer taiwanensis TaxID=986746 RepID=A0ABW1YGS6_9GAMM|nr:hypothetical protein [Microbulbifer taiwanensis]